MGRSLTLDVRGGLGCPTSCAPRPWRIVAGAFSRACSSIDVVHRVSCQTVRGDSDHGPRYVEAVGLFTIQGVVVA